VGRLNELGALSTRLGYLMNAIAGNLRRCSDLLPACSVGSTEKSFVIRNVSLIDLTGASAHPNQTIVIRGNRTMDVGATERLN
jgi:hypothetical protein